MFLLLADPAGGAADPAVFRAMQLGGLRASAAGALARARRPVRGGRPPGALGGSALRSSACCRRGWRTPWPRWSRTFAEGLARGAAAAPAADGVRLLSFPLWLSIAVGIWWCRARSTSTCRSPGAFLMMALLVVGVAVPTPGAVGGFHEAFRIGATAFFGAAERPGGRRGDRAARDLVRAGHVVGAVFMAQEGLSLGPHARAGAAGRRAEEGPP